MSGSDYSKFLSVSFVQNYISMVKFWKKLQLDASNELSGILKLWRVRYREAIHSYLFRTTSTISMLIDLI